jgi:hypothetical protein
VRNPFRRDLVLLHAPALYDFRGRDTFLGPVADAVPSTSMFEMYPVGMTSIAAYLDRNHRSSWCTIRAWVAPPALPVSSRCSNGSPPSTS